MSASFDGGISGLIVDVSRPWVFLALVLLLGTPLIVRWSRRSRSIRSLPMMTKSSGTADFTEMLRAGAEKFPDTLFVIPTNPPTIILPSSCLDEVRNLPENKVSFMKIIKRVFLAKHTGVGNENQAINLAVRNGLNRKIASTIEPLQHEAKFALHREFGPCKDWTPFQFHSKSLRIIALLSGRIFVGRPLSRDEAWVEASITYTIDVAQARAAADRYPDWMRSFVAYFLPEVRVVKTYRAKGAKLLEPMMAKVLQREGQEKLEEADLEGDQGMFMSWVLKYTEDSAKSDPLVMGENQMQLSFGAIHTTTQALTHVIFDLASRPEYFEPLVDEVKQVIAEDGQETDEDGNKILKKTSISKLKKLDSFIKESQRTSPNALVSISRITTAPLTLSTGHTLPKGIRFAFASDAVHHSPHAEAFSPAYNDPTTYIPPTAFDGFRFSKLREMPGKESRHQFVTTAPDSLVFGHGNHACPGRFFAGNEIKIVVLELLRGWELRVENGKGRPKNVLQDVMVIPDPEGVVELRRLSVDRF